MGVAVGGIELYTGPTVLGGPDDLDTVIREFIDGAQTSLLVAVQELDSRPVTEAILAAARRPRNPANPTGPKVRVRVILEASHLTEDTRAPDPFARAGTTKPTGNCTPRCCAPGSM
jgi:hypothetical protein